MTRLCTPSLFVLALSLLLGGCATRPVNPPITRTDPTAGYSFEARQGNFKNKDNLVILAFSGGGTRAAAFSYGVLEFLRKTEVVGPKGNKVRLLDSVNIITGVSGGSFTALAYGLYGDKLFADYEQRFLKRDVQGEIIARTFSPTYWGNLWSTGWGRSELAAQLYDEILFNGATFGDLNRGHGPLILASATDISTGSRFVFTQRVFDIICSDLDAVPLSRAAAASSAVPVVLSPVTFNNYGGTCNRVAPEDKAEFEYLNQLPTSFVLPPEAVDRLRAAAATLIMDSPEFKRLLQDVGARIVADPPRAGAATAVPAAK